MKGRVEHQLKIEKSMESRLSGSNPILKSYYYSQQHHSYKTNEVYFTYIRNFLETVNKEIEAITADDINQFLSKLKMKNNKTEETSGTYRATVWSALKSFFDFCADNKFIDTNPMITTHRPQPKNSDNVKRCVLTEEEIGLILNNIEEGVGNKAAQKRQEKFKSRDRLLFRLFIFTGLRVTAISEINISDLDFDSCCVRTTNKRNKVFEIPLTDEVMPYLEEYLQDRADILGGAANTVDALFISNRGTRLTQAAIGLLVKKYTYNIKGKNITPHKFRGTFATMIYDKTQDISFVQDCMGHSNISTTKIYIKTDNVKQREEAANIISKSLALKNKKNLQK